MLASPHFVLWYVLDCHWTGLPVCPGCRKYSVSDPHRSSMDWSVYIVPVYFAVLGVLGESEDDSASRFIKATLPYVPNPLDDVMVTVVQFGLKHFQVTHFETRRCKRYLVKQKTFISGIIKFTILNILHLKSSSM